MFGGVTLCLKPSGRRSSSSSNRGRWTITFTGTTTSGPNCSRRSPPEAWTRLWDSDVHRRWGELMNPLMHYRDDGIIDSRELREIWHFTPESNGQASDG